MTKSRREQERSWRPYTDASGRALPMVASSIRDEDEVWIVSAKRIYQHGYYEPPKGIDPVKLAKAKGSIAEGQRDPIKITVGRNGRWEVTDGRHRLRAGINGGALVKVQFERGGDLTGSAPDLRYRRIGAIGGAK